MCFRNCFRLKFVICFLSLGIRVLVVGPTHLLRVFVGLTCALFGLKCSLCKLKTIGNVGLRFQIPKHPQNIVGNFWLFRNVFLSFCVFPARKHGEVASCNFGLHVPLFHILSDLEVEHALNHFVQYLNCLGAFKI
jgi:hypothetical protein